MRGEGSAHRTAALAMLCTWLAVSGVAEAQDAECFPACRDGYVCQAGACVAAQVQAVTPTPPPDQGVGNQSGAPLWGPGAQAGGSGAGTQGWSPGAAPTPLSDEEVERRAIRTKTRFVLYALGLLASEGWNKLGGEGGMDAGGGLGVGLRYNFARSVGMQARLLASADNAGAFVMYTPFAEWDMQAVGVDVIGEVGLRLGPVSDSVPWYFGFLAGLGVRSLSGDAMCIATAPRTCAWNEVGEYADGEVRDVSMTLFGLDAGIETGFVFGSMEQFDLGVRATMLLNFNHKYQYGVSIFLGWAVL